MRFFITGGAGYIGSHVVKLLGETYPKAEILVYDNLANGHKDSVLYGTIIKGDMLDYPFLYKTLKDFNPDIILHFAGVIIVPESVEKPLKYYEINTMGSLNLLKAMKELGLNKIIFSSTAAVYGMPKKVPVTEKAPLQPINPYGHSKLMVEQLIKDSSKAYGIKYVILRYFNVAGASPDLKIGDKHRTTSHLIPIVLQAALGIRPKIQIYGTDYPTPDGTAIRDYIHVMDLAEIHRLAAEHLLNNGDSDIFNCGYGKGFSVKQVVETAKKVTGINFPVESAPRRPGDPAILVADSTKLQKALNWKPKYNNLATIIKHAWEFMKKEAA